MRNLIVVSNPKQWNLELDNVAVVAAPAYVNDSRYAEVSDVRIFNLCRSYRYQTVGYYVSLLAEARGQRVFPSVTTMQDMVSPQIVRVVSEDIDELIQKKFNALKSEEFVLSIYFGQNMAKQYEALARRLYNLFQTPLLRARFVFHRPAKKWLLQSIQPIPMSDIPEAHRSYVLQFAREYFGRKQFRIQPQKQYCYDLGILVDPEEKVPPSNKKAIEAFTEAAEERGMAVELLTKDDFSRIPEYDALFLRETTYVNHHTYRFSRRAAAEGLVVLDDPLSILRCTNKVYLAEMLSRAKIAVPKTVVVHKDNRETVEALLGLPCVLKKPDSSFSQGVIKVSERTELQEQLDVLFQTSDLVIAQEFVPTEFDWRIGMLGRRPLYVCKYHMAVGHWQIYNWREKRKNRSYGDVETLPVEAAPPHVVRTAVKAANLIGDGFYGVDIKCVGNRALVMEVNDNPSIDYGVEDSVLKEKLYAAVIDYFLDEIKRRQEAYNGKSTGTV